MMVRLAAAVRLLSGSFTPFLVPAWDEKEQEVMRKWLNGTSFQEALLCLERTIARLLGDGYTVRLLNSGRAAIQMALEAMRLPPDSEVLAPSFCCGSAVVPVIQAGLRPVLVDVDEQFNIRFESIVEADAPSVRAIILPHLSGCWARDTEEILEWAKSRGIFVIEDAAQAFGLRRKGRLAGVFGDVGIFSSGLGKPLFGPGGGWMVSRHPDIVQYLGSRELPLESKVDVSRRLSRFVAYYVAARGSRGRTILKTAIASRLVNRNSLKIVKARSFNSFRFPVYSMSDIEAALALSQVHKIEMIVQKRGEFADRWRERLKDVKLSTIKILPENDNIYTKMLLSFAGEGGEQESTILKRALWAYGVEVESSYTPLHLRPPFDTFRRTSMQNTERLWRGAFAVPVRPNLDAGDWKRIDMALSYVAGFCSKER
jgi:dTDP-4-amino-4,6-dideoxygalactose transaminase